MIDPIECPDCDGQGEYHQEMTVIDYTRGGYLEDRMAECPRCEGLGLVEKPEDGYDK